MPISVAKMFSRTIKSGKSSSAVSEKQASPKPFRASSSSSSSSCNRKQQRRHCHHCCHCGCKAARKQRNTDAQDRRPASQEMQFHPMCGENVHLSDDGRVARRSDSFCKGVAFGRRAVAVDERVYVRFLECSRNWSGVLRFGFTANDPGREVATRRDLPRYVCPDMTNKAGNWAKALGDKYAESGNVLFYYVTAAGDLRYGINDQDKGVFLSGVATTGPLWPMLDLYGNTTAIEFLDTRFPALNNERETTGTRHQQDGGGTAGVTRTLRTLTLDDSVPLPPVVHHNYAHLQPVSLHVTHGFNVQVSPSRTIASRLDDEFCNAYVFVSRPVRLGERIVIQVLRTESVYVGGIGFGLTSCDPNRISPRELPEDSDLLIDRPEYWVVSKDVANTPQQGDELSFMINYNGEVHYSRNGGPSTIVMYVDATQPLFMFFDVYGNTQAMRLLGSLHANIARAAMTRPASSPSSHTAAHTTPPRRPP
ncbi:PREDICTED: protein neuralized-like, partial [Priapulus caudatus]|uniref:Protein neuralized-like n=1 Tax=Priapulus caudatus TaxID=37621 RepID=A0ABM1EAB6_PRICU